MPGTGTAPRRTDGCRLLVDDKKTTMLAETLREWDEQKIAEGRREVLAVLKKRMNVA